MLPILGMSKQQYTGADLVFFCNGCEMRTIHTHDESHDFVECGVCDNRMEVVGMAEVSD